MWDAARARGIPLPTILATVGVVVVGYLLANLVYRLRDVLLLIVVAGFVALLLNPSWWPCSAGASGAAAGPWRW
jgi:hypothetical protein